MKDEENLCDRSFFHPSSLILHPCFSAMQFLESVTSTMDVARENVVSGRLTFNALGRPAYAGILAREQTAGRGQRGRVWYAPPGESLCATYYFRRGLTTPESAGQIPFLAGAAVAETLQRVVIDSQWPVLGPRGFLKRPSHPSISLKWPNDVLLNDKKIAGILVEMVKAPDGEWVALIGVGVNLTVLNFPPEITPYATSLACEGIAFSDYAALGKWIATTLHALADVRRDAGHSAILTRWRRYDRTPGRRYQVEGRDVVRVGVAEGIEESGALRLRLESGEVVAVLSASALRELPPK